MRSLCNIRSPYGNYRQFFSELHPKVRQTCFYVQTNIQILPGQKSSKLIPSLSSYLLPKTFTQHSVSAVFQSGILNCLTSTLCVLVLLTLRLGRRLKCSNCVRCSSEETWKLFQTIECRMESWNIVAASQDILLST